MKKKRLLWGMALILLLALMMLSLTSFDSSNLVTGMLTSEEKDMTGLDLVYSVAPITKVETGYELGEYDTIVNDARELVSRCRISGDKQACISGSLRPGWAIVGEEDGTFYMFEVVSSQKIRQYDPDEKGIIEKNMVYRFALDFS